MFWAIEVLSHKLYQERQANQPPAKDIYDAVQKQHNKEFMDNVNMSDKTSIKIAEEICDNWNGPMMHGFEKDSLVDLIAAAISQERAKQQAVVWPSDLEILTKWAELDFFKVKKGENILFSTPLKCKVDIYDRWLKSQIKPVELPTFTEDEIMDKYFNWADTQHPAALANGPSMVYHQGFRKAIELIKSKMEGG